MSIPDAAGAVFFDLDGTLLQRTQQGWSLAPAVSSLMDVSPGTHLGVLCNLSAGKNRSDLRDLLTTVGLYEQFEPTLLVVATDLGVPLPDRRAFAVAAALAEAPAERCLFVSANLARLLAAAAAGLRTFQVIPSLLPQAGSPVGAPPRLGEGDAGGELLAASTPKGPAARNIASAGAVLLAGEVDEDTGPTFLLKGRLVTMNDSVGTAGVIENGWIAVRRGKIAALGTAENDPIPTAFLTAPTVDTAGTIYPGLMDLHNHLAYNVLPLWVVPKAYSNRSQWPRHKDYAPQVQLPINLLGSYASTARAIVRYVEAKALVGGTTTGQGVRSKQGGMTKLYLGAMRNIEQTDDPRLVEAGSKVLDYKPGSNKETTAFKAALKRYSAYFYHLAEGVDDTAHSHFTDLAQANLIAPALVGIHSLGLSHANLRTVAQRGAKVVWSPYSNLLLYGKTLDLKGLKESEALFSIGCDWSPTGSKNLLQELKVAKHVSIVQDKVLSAQELVRAVTVNAARILGWDQRLGSLKPRAFADLLVITGADGDPYDHLIDAKERDVALVCVHGVPRYGDAVHMQKLHSDAAHPPEKLDIGGKGKAFYLFSSSSPLNDLSLAAATKVLTDAMADLPKFQKEAKDHQLELLAFGLNGSDSFALELDNEYDPLQDTPTATIADVDADVNSGMLLAGGPTPQVAESIELDSLEVDTPEYWQRLEAQKNIGNLAEVLKNAYQ